MGKDVENSTLLKNQDIICLDAAVPLLSPRYLGRNLNRFLAGKVDVALATVASLENARDTVAAIGRWLEVERSGKFPIRVARSVADIEGAKRDGKFAVVLQFQGTHPVEGDVNLLNVYQALGVRTVQLTYNARCLSGDGCIESNDGGLSDFGRKVVQRVRDLALVLDIAHVGVRTSLEAIEAHGGAVICSHANARALCDTPRDLTDEQIRAVAGSGGVIGACAFPAFLSRDETPTLEHFLRHIDYLCGLVGAEHVGLGFDYAEEDEDDYEYFGYDPRYWPRPPWVWPIGISGPADTQNVRLGLEARGYPPETVKGIMGGNFLRVFRAIWGR